MMELIKIKGIQKQRSSVTDGQHFLQNLRKAMSIWKQMTVISYVQRADTVPIPILGVMIILITVILICPVWQQSLRVIQI